MRRFNLARALALALATLGVVCLAAAPSAVAGNVRIAPSGAVQYAGDFDADAVAISDAPLGAMITRVTISEAGITPVPDVAQCEDLGNSVRCDVPVFTTVSIAADDGTTP